jgi:hypothetical protein
MSGQPLLMSSVTANDESANHGTTEPMSTSAPNTMLAAPQPRAAAAARSGAGSTGGGGGHHAPDGTEAVGTGGVTGGGGTFCATAPTAAPTALPQIMQKAAPGCDSAPHTAQRESPPSWSAIYLSALAPRRFRRTAPQARARRHARP